MASENILMAAVAAGGDRQSLHEAIRQHSLAAAEQVKQFGAKNDLVERLINDPKFDAINVHELLHVSAFIGRAPEQVSEFISDFVEPVRRRYARQSPSTADVTV